MKGGQDMLKGLVMAWVFALLSSAYAGADTCVSCHRALDEEELKTPVAGMAAFKHARPRAGSDEDAA